MARALRRNGVSPVSFIARCGGTRSCHVPGVSLMLCNSAPSLAGRTTMNDTYPSRRHTDKPQEKRSLLERLTDFISPEPDSRAELLEILQDAHERNLIDADSLSMIEGVFQVSELSARDIMVPRAQMDAINIADNPAGFIPYVLEKAHSRYPVYEGNRDNIIGGISSTD